MCPATWLGHLQFCGIYIWFAYAESLHVVAGSFFDRHQRPHVDSWVQCHCMLRNSANCTCAPPAPTPTVYRRFFNVHGFTNNYTLGRQAKFNLSPGAARMHHWDASDWGLTLDVVLDADVGTISYSFQHRPHVYDWC